MVNNDRKKAPLALNKKHMKKYILTLVSVSLFYASLSAQSATDALAALIRKKLGEHCMIKDTQGNPVTFEQAADQIISNSLSGKRVRYEPVKVVEGSSKEVIIRFIDPASVKPMIDEIDFSNTTLGFYGQDKQKIGRDEFKNTLLSNQELEAAVFQANEGNVTGYYMIPKSKPQAVQLVAQGGNAPTISTEYVNKDSESVLSVGSDMPEFKMTDIHGKKWNSKELEDKVVVLNFWFVECPPCISEMPGLNKLVDTYKNNERVVFLSISDSNKAKIEKLLEKKEFKYTHIPRESAQKYLRDWGVQMYPQNLVIHNNKITFSFSGGATNNDDFIFELLHDEIKKVLKG
jgi:peroxiredoxin